MINQMFYQVDFISKHPQLLINKKHRLTSVYGGLLSLAYFFLIAAIIYLFGKEFIQKEYPQIISEIKLLTNDDIFKFQERNFTIYFGLLSENSDDIRPKDGILEITTYTETINNIISNYSSNDLLSIGSFSTIDSINSIPIPTINTMLNMNNLLFNDYYLTSASSFNLNISMNQTYYQQMKHNQSLILVINITNNIINLQDYASPIQVANYSLQINLKLQYISELTIPIKVYDVLTDNGVFLVDFSPFETFTIMSPSLYTSQIENIPNENTNNETSNDIDFVRVQFHLCKEKISTIRTYEKLQNLFHDIGGIKEFFSIVSFVLYYFYNDVITKMYLVNKYFDIPVNTRKHSNSDESNSYKKGRTHRKKYIK